MKSHIKSKTVGPNEVDQNTAYHFLTVIIIAPENLHVIR